MATQRGEVYFVDLNTVRGHEQAGRRLVVVVSTNLLNSKPLVVAVVPGTKLARSPIPFPSNVLVPAGIAGLPQDTIFLTFQVRTLDHSRFTDPPCGVLDPNDLLEIDDATRWSLDL
jgi:mRNA interferase MazF